MGCLALQGVSVNQGCHNRWGISQLTQPNTFLFLATFVGKCWIKKLPDESSKHPVVYMHEERVISWKMAQAQIRCLFRFFSTLFASQRWSYPKRVPEKQTINLARCFLENILEKIPSYHQVPKTTVMPWFLFWGELPTPHKGGKKILSDSSWNDSLRVLDENFTTTTTNCPFIHTSPEWNIETPISPLQHRFFFNGIHPINPSALRSFFWPPRDFLSEN